MGDFEACENSVGCLCSFEPPSLIITRESLGRGERRKNVILSKMRPILVVDYKRSEIIMYFRDLITGSLGCEGKANNKSTQYEVKDVHCINAEVKLVKCLVQKYCCRYLLQSTGGT